MGLVDDLDIMERIDEGIQPSGVAMHHNSRPPAIPLDKRDLQGPHGVTTAALEQWVHDARKGDRYAIALFWRALDHPHSSPLLRLAEQATDMDAGDILTQLIERAGIGHLRRR